MGSTWILRWAEKCDPFFKIEKRIARTHHPSCYLEPKWLRWQLATFTWFDGVNLDSTCIQLVLIKLTCTMNGKDLHFNLWKKMGDSGLKALVLISLNPGVFPRLSIAEFNQSHARANPKRNKPYCLCLSSSCVWQDFDSLEEHDNTTSIIYLKHYSSLHYA